MPRPSATAIRAAGGCANVRKDFAHQSETDPLKAGERPGHPVAGWVAEHQQSLGMVGRRGQETLVFGVAANDPVQHDDVVRLDVVRRGRNVDLAAGHPVAHPGCLREFGRVGVVGVSGWNEIAIVLSCKMAELQGGPTPSPIRLRPDVAAVVQTTSTAT
jgi:hypothetical protein